MRAWLAGFVCVATACAGSPRSVEPAPEPEAFQPRVSSDEQRTGDALDRLMTACADGDLATAASGIVDRDLPSSAWHRAMDIEEPGRREAVESLCQRVNGMRRGADYERVAYRKERQSARLWHLCTVRYASDEAEIYAFLEIDGQMLLGDIDPAR
ncbi:MAG: hypothetical protein AB8I08_14270 [Sandaracinaceae bacterium]